MIQPFNPQRFAAFEQLLAQPPPGDLPQASLVCRYVGDPERRTTRLPAIIMGWLQRRHLEVDAQEELPSAARTFKRTRQDVRRANPGLRVLRPTGTG